MSAAEKVTISATRGESPPEHGASRPHRSDDQVKRPRSGVAVGRYQATVVVTVHGELDFARAAHLAHVLADLIDGQGNLSLLVDLHDATAADTHPLSVLADAAERARRRGGAITLSRPPAPLLQALQDAGLGQLLSSVSPATPGRGPASDGTRGRERRAHPAGRVPPNAPQGSQR